ncbi:GtrA family protein [Pseudomonas sp. 18175]|uniref:GtrA family protein n=1 Tax=Pseudomonas sp. 18175 TaxID=3390056 RepID=UPI003D1D0EEF
MNNSTFLHTKVITPPNIQKSLKHVPLRYVTFASRFILYISGMPKTLRLFARYLGAGTFSTLVHFMLFACLLPYQGPAFSTLYAGVAGALTAYYLSRHWVFAQRRCATSRFVITVASQLCSNIFIVAVLTKWGMHPYLAQMTATATVTVQGFTINHFWVFKHDM